MSLAQQNRNLYRANLSRPFGPAGVALRPALPNKEYPAASVRKATWHLDKARQYYFLSFRSASEESPSLCWPCPRQHRPGQPPLSCPCARFFPRPCGLPLNDRAIALLTAPGFLCFLNLLPTVVFVPFPSSALRLHPHLPPSGKGGGTPLGAPK